MRYNQNVIKVASGGATKNNRRHSAIVTKT